jgi:two-component system, NtrC family, response regulator GlrR
MKNEGAVDIFEFGGFVGRSPQMQGLAILLERVAKTEAPLLVVGEPGTYKEAFAEAVHQKSGRKGPFLVVDCGGTDAHSLEVELFGDERQATQGPDGVQRGMFEAASGGTVFLGEVGELSIELQSKLLRAIDRRQIRRVGGASPLPVDARVIASTSRSLRNDLDDRRIRADFYYRITTLQVRIPPLRERLDDIEALVSGIVRELGLAGTSEGAALLDGEFLAKLARYSWPGNARQLRHHVERCSALGDTSLPPSMETFPSTSGSFRVAPSVDSLKMLVARKV